MWKCIKNRFLKLQLFTRDYYYYCCCCCCCCCCFIATASTDGLPFESESQQVSSGLHDFSQYTGRHQHCCNLDGIGFSFDFQLFSPLPSLLEEFQSHQLQFIPLSPLCFIFFLVLWQGLSTCLSFSCLLFSL